MEPPNDDARSGHRAYRAGLWVVHWLGEVVDSELIALFERQNPGHWSQSPKRFEGLRHWVLPLKGVVEMVARTGETPPRLLRGGPLLDEVLYGDLGPMA